MLSEQFPQAHILTYRGVVPKIGTGAFIASGVCVVGDVHIADNANIWFNAVLRGDVNYIRVGENTNIQDGCICHVTNEKFALVIGKDVTVGHNAVLHGCTLQDNCLIGMGAVVMDDAVVESGSMVAAGSVVTPRTVVKSGEIWAGSPAVKMRDMKPEEKEYLPLSALHYVSLARRYQEDATPLSV